MIAFLFKASIIIVVLWLFYRIFLEKESFFATNRGYLLGCILIMFVLPFVSLPELTEKQGLVDRTVDRMNISDPVKLPTENTSPDNAVITINQNAQPVASKEEIAIDPIRTSKGALYWLLLLYYFGVVVLALNLLTQFVTMWMKVLRSSDWIADSGYTIINTDSLKEPCSFFRYIFIDPKLFGYETYEQILAHEKIHVRKLHSIDLMLSEIAVVLLWFNPIIWLFRKEVEKNLEFQTDDILVSQMSIKKDVYQKNLLKIATYNKPLAITTNYNQSLIKQRILKMSSKKSNPHGYWKYAFTVPILFTLVLIMNKPFTAIANTNNSRTGIRISEPENEQQNGIDTVPLKDVSEHPQLGSVSDPGCKELLKAIRDQNAAQVGDLLKTTDPNCKETNPEMEIIRIGSHTNYINGPRTPLVAAAKYGNIEIGKILVEAGADIEFHASHDASPLMSASANGNLNFVKFLLELGADLNRTIDNEGSALITAARNGHLETVKYLRDQGADIEENVLGIGTPLLTAAKNGRLETVEYLLSQGADTDIKVQGEGTALLVASKNGHARIVQSLVFIGADITIKISGEGTALMVASENGSLEIVNYLLSKGADINEIVSGVGSALLLASRNGHLETVKYLISKGAYIDAKIPGEGTSLMAASENGHLQVMKYLLSSGADINGSVNGEGNALLSASRNGHLETMKFLVANGAIVDAITPGEGTPLIGAVRNAQYEAAKFLLDKGADPYLDTPGEQYAMYHARVAKDKSLIALLEKYEKNN